jgi:hypothetical protein
MITQIPLENIRNVSNNTLGTWIILTYQSSKHLLSFDKQNSNQDRKPIDCRP